MIALLSAAAVIFVAYRAVQILRFMFAVSGWDDEW